MQACEAIFESKQHSGLRHIAGLKQVIEESKDVWLAYEVGQQPLGKHMFDVKGEFFHGERIYSVIHRSFYKSLS